MATIIGTMTTKATTDRLGPSVSVCFPFGRSEVVFVEGIATGVVIIVAVAGLAVASFSVVGLVVVGLVVVGLAVGVSENNNFIVSYHIL